MYLVLRYFFFIFPVLRKYTYKYLSETYNQKRYKAKMQDFFFDTLSLIPNEGLKLQNIRNHTNHNFKSIDLNENFKYTKDLICY